MQEVPFLGRTLLIDDDPDNHRPQSFKYIVVIKRRSPADPHVCGYAPTLGQAATRALAKAPR